MRTRDMSRREFKAALQRRGWRQVMVWIDIGGGRHSGMVFDRKLGVRRRASLALACQMAKEQELKDD